MFLGVVYLDHGGFVDDERGALMWVLLKPYQMVCEPEKVVRVLDEFYRQNRAKLGTSIEIILMNASGADLGNPEE